METVSLVTSIISAIAAIIAFGRWIMKGNKYFVYAGTCLALIAIVLAVFGLANNDDGDDNDDTSSVGVTISYPPTNTTQPQNITTKGYSGSLLSPENHLYIVVEYGDEWWPQYGEIFIAYSSTNACYEYAIPAKIGQEKDTGKTFIIRVISVDEAINRHFSNWFEQNRISEDWPGIQISQVRNQGEFLTFDSVTVIRD